MKNTIIILFAVFFIGSVSDKNPTENKVAKVLHQLFDSVKNLKTVQYKISGLERLSKEYSVAKSEVKIQMNPHKLYFHNPQKNIEILYNPKMSESKVLVRNNNIFHIAVMLDPNGTMMRKNFHYTIFDLGFDFISRVMSTLINKDKDGINNIMLYSKCLKNGNPCFLLEYENKQFDYEDYIVGHKETASSIAHKFKVNEHIVRYKNNLLNDFSYLKPGDKIKIPNLYCKKAVIYVDEKLMLPVSASLFDDAGLFETYDFNDIQVNKHFTEEDFDRNNKHYHF